ncbi:ABC transporter substrate-binding protein [Streptomyces gilvus]|uniref:ABC transporter substrate-binding protein n=1 Tax=Streptomyces gilvus TaxID=2920937 RepID=UPI001F1118A5|nr:extracellular solute-binding protein [Streptomyces sp. CME 23]MCH5672448.1 extracellular solute-binding protein [Streptomyces sp. CME 23]
MKKRSLVLATTAAATLALAGCTASGSSTTGSGGKVTISFAHWGNNEENATLKAMVALFEKANPDIAVQSNWIQGDYEQKLQTSIAGGSAPTVAQISNTSLPGFVGAFRKADVRPSDFYSANLARSMSVGGTYYATPFVVKTKAMAVNKKIFQKAGVPLPAANTPMTTDQFATIAAKLTSGSGKSEVFGSAPLWFQGWLTAEGGSFYNADGTRCTNGSAVAVKTADLIIRAQSSNGFTPSYLGAQGQDMFDWLSIGRLAMQPDFGPWNIAQLVSLSNSADYALVPDPGRGEPMEIDGLAVSKTAAGAQAAAAQKFATFMATDTAAQQRLTTKTSSLGVPVVKAAVSSFEAAAPSLNLKVFIDAVDQSTVTATPKQDPQIQSTFNNELFSRTAIGSGHDKPATVLPQLQQECQKTLDSAGAGQ